MSVKLLNNYPENKLEDYIKKEDGSPLYGEKWLYEQFVLFNKYNLVDTTWYLKHDYNLATHPCAKKVEGQVDFLLLTKYGLLIFEVKGGGLKVNEDDEYISYNQKNPDGYKTENPFNQAKDYTHTLRKLLATNVFVYRAVILPHEAGFKLTGPQLQGYENLFFSKKDYSHLDNRYEEKAINKLFYDFLIKLAKSSRYKIIKELHPGFNHQKISESMFKKPYGFPELSPKQIKSLKSELFPTQNPLGYNPDRINSEIIFKENYETLQGLKRNKKVIVQGAPGTGKTVLGIKYLAENILKNQNGIYFCANILVKAKLENLIFSNYSISKEQIVFKIYNENSIGETIENDIDFVIFDEAQEYFNNGLYELIEDYETKLDSPKFLILYDPDQTVHNQNTDIDFYTDFYIENNFTHYFFDESYRSSQNKNIAKIAQEILFNKKPKFNLKVSSEIEKMKVVKNIIKESKFLVNEKIILVHSSLIDSFKNIITDFYKDDIQELTKENINIPSSKIKYTTPIKYRGLENKSVYLITNQLNDHSKTQNYIAVTRAMENLEIILWEK